MDKSFTLSTMKDVIVEKVDSYFLYSDLERILPEHPKSSIMARVHELISERKIERVRKASKGGKVPAIYRKI